MLEQHPGYLSTSYLWSRPWIWILEPRRDRLWGVVIGMTGARETHSLVTIYRKAGLGRHVGFQVQHIEK